MDRKNFPVGHLIGESAALECTVNTDWLAPFCILFILGESFRKRISSGLQKLRKKSYFTLFKAFTYSERMFDCVLLYENNEKSYESLCLFRFNISLRSDLVIQVFNQILLKV